MPLSVSVVTAESLAYAFAAPVWYPLLLPAPEVCAAFAEGERKPVLMLPAGVWVNVGETGVLVGVEGTDVLMMGVWVGVAGTGVLVDLGGTGVLVTGVLVGPGVGVGEVVPAVSIAYMYPY